MKTIISFYAPANSGKTRSIRRVDEILQSYGAKATILFDEYDFAKEYIFRKKKIGMLSLGDPGSAQDDWLDKLFKDNCEIIVCASRSKGTTRTDIEKRLSPDDKAYWISPLYEDDNSLPFQADMHEINARFIIKVMFSII